MPADSQEPVSDGRPAFSQPGDVGAGPTPGPSAFHFALIVVLITALAVGAIALLFQLDPAGPWRLMPVYALIVAAESVITRHWLEKTGRKRQHPLYSLAELVVVLSLAPLFLWLAEGSVPFPASLREAVVNPLSVFSVPLVLFMLLALLVWDRAHSWATCFIQLAITRDEIRYYASTTTERSLDPSLALPLRDRNALLNSFAQSWIAGGILLVVLTALASIDLAELTGWISGGEGLRTVTRLGLREDSLLAMLVYFLGGLWLISQGRAVVLKARWLAAGSQPEPGVVARWRTLALLVIVALALLALFLPIGTTYPLLRVVRAVIGFVSTIIGVLLGVIALLIFVIVSLLPDSVAPDRPPIEPGQLLQQTRPPAGTTVSAPSPVAGSLLWMALIALAFVATLYFLSDRGPNVSLDRLWELWRRLRRWLAAFGREAAAKVAVVSGPVRWRLRRPTVERSGPPFRFFRIGALPPTEQVRFLYLSLVRHAGEQGLPRSDAATPLEFCGDLKAGWPEAGADLDHLTAAFLVARYGSGEIDRAQLRSAREAWLRIRRRGRPTVKTGETESGAC